MVQPPGAPPNQKKHQTQKTQKAVVVKAHRESRGPEMLVAAARGMCGLQPVMCHS